MTENKENVLLIFGESETTLYFDFKYLPYLSRSQSKKKVID